MESCHEIVHSHHDHLLACMCAQAAAKKPRDSDSSSEEATMVLSIRLGHSGVAPLCTQRGIGKAAQLAIDSSVMIMHVPSIFISQEPLQAPEYALICNGQQLSTSLCSRVTCHGGIGDASKHMQ